jgi:hypothetical protein
MLPTVIVQALFVEAFQNTECLPKLLKKFLLFFSMGITQLFWAQVFMLSEAHDPTHNTFNY